MAQRELSDLSARYAFCDPASGKGKEAVKRVRSRSAIIVVAMDDLCRFFVLHTWADRCGTDKLIDRITETARTWRPRTFGIEANALQSLFVDAVRRDARRSNITLPLTGVTQPTKVDKDWRIRSVLQPIIAEGRLFIQRHQYELLAEIETFPMGSTKDLIDALASAIALAPRRAIQSQRRSEADALRRYLEASHAPAEYITNRVDEVLRAEGERA